MMTLKEFAAKKRSALISKRLRRALRVLPEDYTDYGGNVVRWADPKKSYPDCSCGCKFYVPVEEEHGADWGVCTNTRSHRIGLLTFEHQGCQKFVRDPEL